MTIILNGVKHVKEHDVFTAVKFLEDEVICRYRMPKYVLIDNGSEWMKEFVEICKIMATCINLHPLPNLNVMAWLSI